MSAGAIGMMLIILVTLGVLGYLLFVMTRGIYQEVQKGARPMRDFGLSISLMILFFVSWLGHGMAQWQRYTDDAVEHGQQAAVGDFMAQFMTATLENWQSEFLQLFSFVVLAALLIHKGSAESKDSDEEMQAALKRIEEKLGTSPDENKQKEPVAAGTLGDSPRRLPD